MTRLLEGVKILEVAAFHNAPAAAYMLADHGADVIKIEQPGEGDPYRGWEMMFGAAVTSPAGRVIPFEIANRNKKSVTLNLHHEEGRRILRRLIEDADVFLTNYRNSAVKMMDIEYETLSRINPRLVYCRVTNYGPQGPDSNQRGFDQSAQARSGFMWSSGDRDHSEPWLFVGGFLDQLCGTLAAWGITMALLARERTGKGTLLDTSLLGSALHLQAANITYYGVRGREWQRHSRQRARNPLANHYPCADGKWILLAEPQSDRFWPSFCRVMGLEEIEHDPRFKTALLRRDNCIGLNALIEQAFLSRPRDEWLEIFRQQRAEFAYAPVLTLPEAVEDEQAIENNYVVEHEYPDVGPIKLPGFPIDFAEAHGEIRTLAPELGQHTEEVLIERLGYCWDDIVRLRDSGVI